MPLQGNADAVPAQPFLVRKLAAGAAQQQRDVQLGVHGLNLGPGAGAGQEDGIHTGGFVSLDPADALVHALGQAAGASSDYQVGVGATGQGGLHLAHAFLQGYEPGAAAELHGQHGVLDGQRGNAGGFQLLDGSLDAEGVAVAVVRVHHQGQLPGAADAVNLLGKFAEGQHHVVRRAQHRSAGDGAGEHTDLEPQILGGARRNRVKHRAGMHADIAG